MAANAQELVESIRTELKPLDEKIRRHPYLAAVEAGQTSRESLEGFVGHQYHIIESNMRSVSILLAQHGENSSRDFLTHLLQGEGAAFEACKTFGKALGVDEEGLKGYEPSPGDLAYAAFLAWVACFGSDAELATAFLVNTGAWGSNSGRMGHGLQDRYEFDEADLAFFFLFAETPSSFVDGALAVIDDGLARGIEPRLMARAARLLQGYELMYWDTMHTL